MRRLLCVLVAVISGVAFISAGDIATVAVKSAVSEIVDVATGDEVVEASHNCVYQWVVSGYGGIGGSKCTHLSPGQRQRVWVYCSNGGPPKPGPWRYNGGEWSYAQCSSYYYLTNVAQEVAWYI